MKDKSLLPVVLCLIGAWLLLGGSLGGCPAIVPPTVKATAATYFFDDKQHVIPSPVAAALSTLNKRGITATVHEVDTTDGDDQIPDQYKVSLPVAKEAGLPSLVVMGGEKVLRVVKEPKTEEDVIGAVP